MVLRVLIVEYNLMSIISLRYVWAHIWACPPCEGDDYIFHCHPPEQKIPRHKRLVDWYKKMLDKAAAESIVVEYKVMSEQKTLFGRDNISEEILPIL